MTFDRIAFGLLVISFATLLTTHVALTIGLARRAPLWRALVAFVAFPLAPWWGWRERMHRRGLLWAGAATCYAVAFVLASVG